MGISSESEFFSEVRKHPDRFYIAHYSCQSLYDDNEGLSPRVTSIAVLHFATEQTVSFSTHAIAEELGISRSDVSSRFDEIESRLLQNFYAFARDRRDKYWVHWNMRNITYGFEHIDHRYRTLTQTDPPVIAVEQRINLNDMLSQRFGKGYALDPKMADLMDLNGGRHRHFLTGVEEVQAFRQSEFIRMHQSTLCKVIFFKTVMQKVIEGRLVTRARGFWRIIDRSFDSRLARGVGFASSIVTILGIVYAIASYVFGIVPRLHE